MDSEKFRRHPITFGIFSLIFRIRKLGSFSPDDTWNFELMASQVQCADGMCKISEASDNIWHIFFSNFPNSALGEFCTTPHLDFWADFFAGKPSTMRGWILQNFRGIFRIRHLGSVFRPEHVPWWVVRGLGISFRGLLGAIRDSESLSAGALALWGGPGTWGIFSPSRGTRMGRSSLSPKFCGSWWAWGRREGRIEAT